MDGGSDDEVIRVAQRPARELIEVLHNIDDELLKDVSERSLRVKHYVKTPMLYLCLNAGLQSGLSIAFLKLFGELVQSGTAIDHFGMLVILGFFMALSAVSQTHSLNLAMKEYD